MISLIGNDADANALPAGHYEDAKAFGNALYGNTDSDVVVARYETDAEMFAATRQLQAGNQARFDAAGVTKQASVDVWSQALMAEGSGWRALIQRKTIPMQHQETEEQQAARIVQHIKTHQPDHAADETSASVAAPPESEQH